MGFLDDLNRVFDPHQNGVADAFDPNKNGFNNAMDPTKNGVADALNPAKNGASNFFTNSVGPFFTNTVGPFFKNTVGPIVQNLFDTLVVAPMKFMGDLYKAGSKLLSGNGLTYIILGVTGIVVIGGIVYYKQNGKIK